MAVIKTVATDPAAESEFRRAGHIGWQVAATIAMATACLVVAALVFAAPIVIPEAFSHSPMHLISLNALVICAVFGYWTAVRQIKTPIRLLLDDDGMVQECLITRSRIPWAAVATLEQGKTFLWSLSGSSEIEVLVLRTKEGKKLAELTALFHPFRDVVAQVRARSSAAQQRDTLDPAREQLRIGTKARRTQHIARIALPFILLIGGLAMGVGFHDWRVQQSLASTGTTMEAAIERHYLYNGFAPRLTYRFTASSGTVCSNDVLLTRAAWNALKGKATVPIRYLPAKASVNQPVSGLDGGVGSPMLMMLAGLGFIVLMGSIAVMACLGYELDVAPGSIRLKRLDEPNAPLRPPLVPRTVVPPMPFSPRPPTRTSAKRPVGITWLASLNIAFGILGLLVNAALVLFHLFQILMPHNGTNAGPMEPVCPYVPLLLAGIKLCAAVVLIVSAVGLFMMRKWGRRLALGAAAVQCLMGACSIGLTIWYGGRGAGDGQAISGAAFGAVVGIALLIIMLGMVYPTVLLGALGRRKVSGLFK